MNKRYFNFLKYRRIAIILSSLLFLISILSIFVQNFNLGIDFTGGNLIEVTLQDKSKDVTDLRKLFAQNKIENYSIQKSQHNRYIIQINDNQDNRLLDKVRNFLVAFDPNIIFERTDFVGGQIGEELRDKGGLGLLIALLCIFLYISFRFQYKFAIAAVIALIHDVILTVGIFSIFQIEMNTYVIAALLAIIGYSLNDTIVVSDRIRENILEKSTLYVNSKGGLKMDLRDVINYSLTETFGRTIITSLTTLFVLFAIISFGGSALFEFALALILGVAIGTYSSIYINSVFVYTFGVRSSDFIKIKSKEAKILV